MTDSGAGRNLEVGGGTRPAQSTENNPLVCPSTILALQVQLVVLVSVFLMVSTICRFLACCSTRGAPRAQPFVKVGARAPVPYDVGASGDC